MVRWEKHADITKVRDCHFSVTAGKSGYCGKTKQKKKSSTNSIWGLQDTCVYRHLSQCAVTLLRVTQYSVCSSEKSYEVFFMERTFCKKGNIIIQCSKKMIYHFPLSVTRQSVTTFPAYIQLPASSRKLQRKAKRWSRGYTTLSTANRPSFPILGTVHPSIRKVIFT
jgi:hypothetical protein